MAVMHTVARTRVGAGTSVERLVCHPRLPLVAGLSPGSPAVRIWDCAGRDLREIGTIGWDRMPPVAWHPTQPLLVASGEDGVRQWTTSRLSEVDAVSVTAAYRYLAFSPDGRALWASPSSSSTGYASDVIDLAVGTVGAGPWWDTGVAVHPAGGLMLTFSSDQGATLGLFVRADGTAMRVLRRALILDCDGYETPVFSPDGAHFAVRGNAYDNSVEVFAFPSLERVLTATLGEPSPGYPYPPEWLEQMRAWSRHAIAFTGSPGVLWIGTPDGSLVEVNLTDSQAVAHDVLSGAVTALATTATGELVVAGDAGELLLLVVDGAEGHASPAGVTAFLEATSDVPADGDLESHLVLTDGSRSWKQDDLATVTTAEATDPTWLRIQAAMNVARNRAI
jgi:hypothetical protein